MSETGSNPSTSPFDEQIRQRIADALVGLTTAAHAVGLEEHLAMLRDHRQRVQDSHAAMMRSLGYEVPSPVSPSAGQGGITVTGDIHTHQHQPAPSTPSTTSSAWRRAAPWLIAAATLLGGAGAGAGVTALMTAGKAAQAVAPAVEQSVEDLGFDVIRGEANRAGIDK